MSQDHLFSAIKRPRESIYGSGIPQPASAAKRVSTYGSRPSTISNPRMSLAPSRGLPRPSIGGNLADLGAGGFSTVKRESSAAKFSSRKSFAPGSSQPQPPSTMRRSSQYGRPSMGIPVGNSLFSTASQIFSEDPRPLKTQAWRQRAAAQIQEYITHHGFEMDMKHSLTPKSLISPTQKDFQTIFEWLYKRIDPNHRITKVETEVLALLKTLRYPYPHTITKSQLSAVGSQNAWPQFLGMLHWMMELAQATDRIIAGDFDQLAEEEGFDMTGDRIAFRYATKCYNAWLLEEDDHSEFEREMAEAYAERDEAIYQQLEILEAENAELLATMRELEAQGEPLKQLREQRDVLEDDKRKYQTYTEATHTRLNQRKAAVESLNAEIISAKEEQERLEAEKASLQHQVDKQGLAPEEIDRMNSDREKLDRSWKQIQEKFQEAKVKLAETEGEAQSAIDSLERAVSRYTTLAYQIGITPASAANAGGKEFDLAITPLQNFDPRASTLGESGKLLVDPQTGYQPPQVLNRDLRGDIRPALQKLKSNIAQKIHTAQDEATSRQELFDKIAEALLDKKEDMDTMEAKVAAANNEYQELKETITQESTHLTAALEKQSSQLQTLRVSTRKGVLETDQALQAITMECDQLYHAQTAIREKLHAQTARIVEDVVAFKLHIQSSLSDYEERTEMELMQIVGNFEQGRDGAETPV